MFERRTSHGSSERSELPCDVLRSNILAYRSRCYRRQRDLEAAREDVERALELAQSLDDTTTMANVYVQASLVAERMGHWVLARNYAERAKTFYEQGGKHLAKMRELVSSRGPINERSDAFGAEAMSLMGVIAFVLEKAVMRSVRKGGGSTPAREPTTITTKGAEADLD